MSWIGLHRMHLSNLKLFPSKTSFLEYFIGEKWLLFMAFARNAMQFYYFTLFLFSIYIILLYIFYETNDVLRSFFAF